MAVVQRFPSFISPPSLQPLTPSLSSSTTLPCLPIPSVSTLSPFLPLPLHQLNHILPSLTTLKIPSSTFASFSPPHPRLRGPHTLAPSNSSTSPSSFTTPNKLPFLYIYILFICLFIFFWFPPYSPTILSLCLFFFFFFIHLRLVSVINILSDTLVSSR